MRKTVVSWGKPVVQLFIVSGISSVVMRRWFNYGLGVSGKRDGLSTFCAEVMLRFYIFLNSRFGSVNGGFSQAFHITNNKVRQFN